MRERERGGREGERVGGRGEGEEGGAGREHLYVHV